MRAALSRHWPEYLLEALELGLFMLATCLYVVAFEHPSSPIRQAIADPLARRAVLACVVGLTAVAIIYSPAGKRSGAHFNPSVTLAFLRLGKVEPWDAACYIAAQFLGGLGGVLVGATLLRGAIAAPTVDFAVTVPGSAGSGVALLAELAISFVLMTTVLIVSNTPRLARYTGLVAGALVTLYIVVEAPISGMSMNPARSLASAVPAQVWTALWIYFVAPPVGMLLAAELYLRRGARAVICAKLHHSAGPCIFRCGYREIAAQMAPRRQQVAEPRPGPEISRWQG